MRRILLISFFVFIFFIFEFFLFNFFGRSVMPNLLLILIVFFNLSFGIRYSLLTAFLAGILKDSFSAGPFGMYAASFMSAAFMSTVFKKYVYSRGSHGSWLLLVSLVSLANIFIQWVIQLRLGSNICVYDILRFILLPEVISTMVIAHFIFYPLKKCVLKLYE